MYQTKNAYPSNMNKRQYWNQAIAALTCTFVKWVGGGVEGGRRDWNTTKNEFYEWSEISAHTLHGGIMSCSLPDDWMERSTRSFSSGLDLNKARGKLKAPGDSFRPLDARAPNGPWLVPETASGWNNACAFTRLGPLAARWQCHHANFRCHGALRMITADDFCLE